MKQNLFAEAWKSFNEAAGAAAEEADRMSAKR
jgi:hypothetical protein